MNPFGITKVSENEFSVTEKRKNVGFITTSDDDQCIITSMVIPNDIVEQVLPVMESFIIKNGCKKSRILVDPGLRDQKLVFEKLGYSIRPYGSRSDIAEKRF